MCSTEMKASFPLAYFHEGLRYRWFMVRPADLFLSGEWPSPKKPDKNEPEQKAGHVPICCTGMAIR